jgi:hypothetical protein
MSYAWWMRSIEDKISRDANGRKREQGSALPKPSCTDGGLETAAPCKAVKRGSVTVNEALRERRASALSGERRGA